APGLDPRRPACADGVSQCLVARLADVVLLGLDLAGRPAPRPPRHDRRGTVVAVDVGERGPRAFVWRRYQDHRSPTEMNASCLRLRVRPATEPTRFHERASPLRPTPPSMLLELRKRIAKLVRELSTGNFGHSRGSSRAVFVVAGTAASN